MWRVLMAGCLALVATTATAQRANNAPFAELRWLDRITGEQGDVTLAIGQRANLGSIAVVVEECRYPAGSISRDAFAFLDITQPSADTETPIKQWFAGWMVASSPALNGLEHPRYDVWVLRCRTS
ncbi:MAG: DUF2155 domain-containing protein [Pseudomonadota bacterium]